MAKEFKTLEEALEAQEIQKKEVEKVKKDLTKYFTKNKLKRNEDYTDDLEHGPKIAKLEKEIDKKEETMAKVKEQVKDLQKTKGKKTAAKEEKSKKEGKAKKETKPKKEKSGEGRVTKYDYPKDCDSSQKKKLFRVAARAAEKAGKDLPKSYAEVEEARNVKASAKAKKEDKPKKEAKETGKKAKDPKAKKEEPKTKKAKKSEEEKPKKKSKKAKKVEDD